MGSSSGYGGWNYVDDTFNGFDDFGEDWEFGNRLSNGMFSATSLSNAFHDSTVPVYNVYNAHGREGFNETILSNDASRFETNRNDNGTDIFAEVWPGRPEEQIWELLDGPRQPCPEVICPRVEGFPSTAEDGLHSSNRQHQNLLQPQPQQLEPEQFMPQVMLLPSPPSEEVHEIDYMPSPNVAGNNSQDLPSILPRSSHQGPGRPETYLTPQEKRDAKNRSSREYNARQRAKHLRFLEIFAAEQAKNKRLREELEATALHCLACFQNTALSSSDRMQMNDMLHEAGISTIE